VQFSPLAEEVRTMALSREEDKSVLAALSDNFPGAPSWRLCLTHFTERAHVRSERQNDVATLVRATAENHGASTEPGGHCDAGHAVDGLIVVGPVRPIG